MKISRNDPFDLNLCVRGLGVMITAMHSDLYEYTYHMTFKKAMKAYAKDFANPWEQPIEQGSFFEGIEDPFVQNCFKAENRLINSKLELALRYGIDEVEDLENEALIFQSYRYRPYQLIFKRSKSYKKLKLYYERTLIEMIEAFYSYACVFTAQSYKIPRVLKKQFSLSEEESLRLLNHDDTNVEFLCTLIEGLRSDLAGLRILLKK